MMMMRMVMGRKNGNYLVNTIK